MATETITAPITMEQFLELERNAPEDVHLEVINGELREYPGMTIRSPQHAEAITYLSAELLIWLRGQSGRMGAVASGEARCRLNLDPGTIVGLDVAYFEGKKHVHRPDGQKFFDGPPLLGVEVLSGSDTHAGIRDRIRELLAAGVKQVWQADPDFRTVIVHRPGATPVFYSEDDEISGDPDLPGFRCRIGRLFSSLA